MIIGFAKLKTLPVKTKSGIILGNVSDIEFDSDSQGIVKYLVIRKNLLIPIAKFLVSREQIIAINADEVIVDDAVCHAEASSEEKLKQQRLVENNVASLNIELEEK